MAVRRVAAVPAGGHSPDEGTVTLFVAVLGAALLLVTGVIVDGGRLLNRYVEANELAGSAARAAAQAVDRPALYAGQPPTIVAGDAQTAAETFMAGAGTGGSVSTVVVGDEVTVQVSLDQALMMLPGGSQTVTAQATATLQHGVESPR